MRQRIDRAFRAGPARATAATAATLWALAVMGALGCSKPSGEDCTKAIANIERLTGTADTSSGPARRGAVRACRSNASPDSVRCFVAARTVEDLDKCDKGGVFKELLEKEREAKPAEGGEGGAP